MLPNYRRYAAFRFFLENAGYIVGQHAQCALELARAEEKAKTQHIVFKWEPDEDADWSWLEQDCIPKSVREADHEVYGCRAFRVTVCDKCGTEKREEVASLYGIFDPDASYRRVVEAELAYEALSQ